MAGPAGFGLVPVRLMGYAGQEDEELLVVHLVQRCQIVHGIDFGHHAFHEARIDAAVVDGEFSLIQNSDAFLEIDELLVRIQELLKECFQDLLILSQ